MRRCLPGGLAWNGAVLDGTCLRSGPGERRTRGVHPHRALERSRMAPTIPGSEPKDRLGEARPPRAFAGDPWTIMVPRPSSAAHSAKLGFWSTLFHYLGGPRFRRFLRVLRRRGDSFSVPNLRPVQYRRSRLLGTKWPRIAVFGGKIELTWPDNKQPEWAVRDWLVGFAFPRHHYAETEAFYKPLDYPFGPNFSVGKVVFQKVPFFDETIGARPRNRIMGEEATFLLNLQEHGSRYFIILRRWFTTGMHSQYHG